MRKSLSCVRKKLSSSFAIWITYYFWILSLTRQNGLVYFLDLSVILKSSKSRNLVEGKMTFTILTNFDSFCSQWFHSDYDMTY